MNILILSTMFPNTVNKTSGIFVYQQIKAISELGVKFTVVAPIPYTFFPINRLSEKWKNISKIPVEETIEGITVLHTKFIAIPNGYLKDFWAYSYVNSALKKIKELHSKNPFDLIHAHGSLPDDHAAMILSQKLGVPFIITVHGYTINELYKKRTFHRSKKAILKADAVIGISEKVVKRINELTGRSKHLFKIFNGCNKSDSITHLEVKNNAIRILFGGNMVESKGCEYLLRAFLILKDKFDNIVLDIAGGGVLLPKMKELAAQLNILEKVSFYGAVTNDRMLELMNHCNIFALPSFNEGFGIVYLEAMSLKKPVIGTQGEGISEIIKDGFNGFLVKPKDVNSLVEKLELLIKSQSLRNKIGLNGFGTVKNLTWQNNAEQTMNVYNLVLRDI